MQADVHRIDTERLLRCRRVAQRHQHGAPIDDLEGDVEIALLQVLLQVFVHRQRQHLPRAAGGDHDLRLDRLVRVVARLLEQGFAFGRIIDVLLLRVAEERIGLLEQPIGRLGEAVEEALEGGDEGGLLCGAS